MDIELQQCIDFALEYDDPGVQRIATPSVKGILDDILQAERLLRSLKQDFSSAAIVSQNNECSRTQSPNPFQKLFDSFACDDEDDGYTEDDPEGNQYTFESCKPAIVQINQPVVTYVIEPMGIPTGYTINCKQSKSRLATWTISTEWHCAVCDRYFKRKRGLILHNFTYHSGLKSHRCDICGKRFELLEALEKHHTRHVEVERKYKCKLCTKQYHYRYDLKRHISMHHGEAPYQCSYCAKGFGRKDHVTAHEMGHLRRQHISK